jgi:hypothetical protein
VENYVRRRGGDTGPTARAFFRLARRSCIAIWWYDSRSHPRTSSSSSSGEPREDSDRISPGRSPRPCGSVGEASDSEVQRPRSSLDR